MAKLRDLDGRLLWKLNGLTTFRDDCTDLSKAQGVIFLCPKCFEVNKGEIGTHSIVCWFKDRGVPDEMEPNPGRWNPLGTGIDDLTFVPPGATSVLLTGEGCGWHGFITNGNVT